MRNSIRFKILVPLIAITSGIAIVGSYFLYDHFNKSLVHELNLRTENLADAVRRSIEISANRQYLQRIINAYGDSEGLELIALAGGVPLTIIASTKHKYIGLSANHLLDDELSSQLKEVIRSKKAILAYNLEQHNSSATIPVLLRPQIGEIRHVPGVLTVQIDSTATQNSVNRTALIWALAFTSVLIMMTGLTYALLNRIIITPITYLREIAQLRTAGDAGTRAEVSSNDEIGGLSTELNAMLNRIQQEENHTLKIMQLLEDSQERLNLALDATHDGLWDVEVVSEKVFLNKNWYEMLGYTGTHRYKNIKSWFQDIHPDDRERIIHAWEAHLAERDERFEAEFRFKTKYDEWLWVLIRGKIVISSETGFPIRAVGTLSDISERKQTEKLKDQFVSVVSHELRTPLTSINGSLKLLNGLHRTDFDARSQNLIDVAQRNSVRLIELINDILDIAKLESDEFSYKSRKIELVKIVKDNVEVNAGYGVNFNVSLDFESQVDEFYMFGDEQRLSQVFSNLLSNAVKFSKSGDVVCVTIVEFNQGVRVTVRDFGPGIPQNSRAHIFEKFTQADTSDTRNVGGTGLGLNIAKRIIEHHHGTISFDSITNEGTAFYVDLPMQHDSQAKSDSFSASA